jgi:hypothetical protein
MREESWEFLLKYPDKRPSWYRILREAAEAAERARTVHDRIFPRRKSKPTTGVTLL